MVRNGVGAYPHDERAYPSESGFTISGLAATLKSFAIDQASFKRALLTLGPRYVGRNGAGAINFAPQYQTGHYAITTDGQLVLQPGRISAALAAGAEPLATLPLEQF